jgi:antitoxin component YwqK of YwqJK toxin-antitoxin module
MKTIKLPCYGIVIQVEERGDNKYLYPGGTIESDLHQETTTKNGLAYDFDEGEQESVNAYESAIHAIEALILAHACSGVNVESLAYIEGIETAVDAAANNC